MCYKIGEFWYAAKAFDMLERMDPTPDHWEGKRGACCGTFQYIIAEKQPKFVLKALIELLLTENIENKITFLIMFSGNC